MVGEFVVEGAPLLWLWAPSPDDQSPDPATFGEALHVAVRLGYERTAEQDVAFGVRQLADIAVKALSPAINDPYTSIQALEHLGVLLAKLVRRPLGNQYLYDDAGTLRVVVPGRDLSYYLDLATGQIRRFGCAEPRVDRALLRVLATTGTFCRDSGDRALIAEHVQLVAEDARRTIPQPADLAPVRSHAALVLHRRPGGKPAGGGPFRLETRLGVAHVRRAHGHLVATAGQVTCHGLGQAGDSAIGPCPPGVGRHVQDAQFLH